MMKKLAVAVAIVSLGAVALIATAIAKNGEGGGRSFHTNLDGYDEVPSNSTTGRGSFSARLENSDTLRYRLTFRDLEGGAVSAAHIHLGQRHTEGSPIAFLCDGNPATPAPACTSPVEGTLTAASVIGPAAQGIDPAESDRFQEMIRAMRHEATYVNVHTAFYPDGEIRGQIDHGRHHGRSKKDDD
jgi:CHRD domain-containing protein